MKTVTLKVRSLKNNASRGAAETVRIGKGDKFAHVSFASPERLWEVLTAKRYEIVKALTGWGRSTSAKSRGGSSAT